MRRAWIGAALFAGVLLAAPRARADDVQKAQQSAQEEVGKAKANAASDTQKARDEAQQKMEKTESQASKNVQKAENDASKKVNSASEHATNTAESSKAAAGHHGQRRTKFEGKSNYDVNGTVAKVSGNAVTLRRQDLPSVTLRTDPGTRVQLNGNPARVSELKPGQNVRASFNLEGSKPIAVDIKASGGSHH